MTKLNITELIDYFKNLKLRVEYDDYIFPEAVTAEYIANVFNVDKTTVFRRLKQLENYGKVVSKKAHVENKSGKSLVFFLRENLPDDKFNKEDLIKKSIDRSRKLLFMNVIRTVKLDKECTATCTSEYRIKNISVSEITEVPLPKFRFDTPEKDTFDDLLNFELNGEVLENPTEQLKINRKTEIGFVSRGIISSKNPVPRYVSEVYYTIPLDTPLKSGEDIHVKYTTRMKKSFTRMYRWESTGFFVQSLTRKLTINLIPPEGHSIINYRKYSDKIYKNGVLIIDSLTDLRNDELEKIIKPPVVKNNMIKLVVDEPIIGYFYIIPFVVSPSTE